jgi:DNA-binding transcriptional LysR family regulator
MKLTLDALQVLDAIDRKGSFAAAAQSLHRVPSAVSYTVQKTEQELGVTLFQKQGRRAVLTRAGEHLLEQGRELLAAAEQLADSTRQVATGWEPRLRIALDHVIPTDILLSAIQALYAKQPGIEIEISKEVLGGTWENLMDNRVDLAVGADNQVPGHQGIRAEEWLEVDMVFAVSPEHPVCREPRPLTRETLARHRTVVVPDSSRHRPAISRGILNRESALLVSDMSEKLQAQRSGLGVGSVPRHAAAPWLERGELVEIELEEPMKPSPVMLAWRTSNRGQALQLLLEQLRAVPANALGRSIGLS